MKILIKEAKIIDPQSPFHNQIVDVKISGSTIEEIGLNIASSDDYEEIKMDNNIIDSNQKSEITPLLVLSWIVVSIPLCYGIYKTFLKALALF